MKYRKMERLQKQKDFRRRSALILLYEISKSGSQSPICLPRLATFAHKAKPASRVQSTCLALDAGWFML